jgi:hypothetical protein
MFTVTSSRRRRRSTIDVPHQSLEDPMNASTVTLQAPHRSHLRRRFAAGIAVVAIAVGGSAIVIAAHDDSSSSRAPAVSHGHSADLDAQLTLHHGRR